MSNPSAQSFISAVNGTRYFFGDNPASDWLPIEDVYKAKDRTGKKDSTNKGWARKRTKAPCDHGLLERVHAEPGNENSAVIGLRLLEAGKKALGVSFGAPAAPAAAVQQTPPKPATPDAVHASYVLLEKVSRVIQESIEEEPSLDVVVRFSKGGPIHLEMSIDPAG